MASPLQTSSVAAPGFFGLNTQESSVTLQDGFALVADNCIIDKYGRLGSRKGWRYLTTTILGVEVSISTLVSTGTTATATSTAHGLTSGDSVVISGAGQTEYNGTFEVTVTDADTFTYTMTSDPAIDTATGTIVFQLVEDQSINLLGMHRFIDIAGEETILSWSATKFYTGVGTMTEIVPTTDNTIADGNWQCATLNDKAYFFQSGYKPMVYDPVANTITDIESAYADYDYASEAEYTAVVPQGNTVLSAYGRLWVADIVNNKMTMYFSDLLDGSDWGTGSAGSLDLSSILVKGTDRITGLGAQNGQLIIFCEQNIVIFDDNTGGASFDPATMRLIEVISRVGCIARDSIQNTGLDIFFLSEDGLRSLGRVIQEKSLPMRDLSLNVRDDLVQATRTETNADIKSAYSEDNAFYLLLFPVLNRIYCFDTRAPLQNGSLRVTIWDTQTQQSLLAIPNNLYFAQANGIADYHEYTDNGSVYRMKYFTTYFDFGQANMFKLLKRIATTIIGGNGQAFVLKSGFDYEDAYDSYPANLLAKSNDEYNVSEYGLNNTVLSGSQGANTVTVATGEHYTLDFQLTQDEIYNTPLKVWLDTDTYYYSVDDGTRTRQTLYTRSTDYSTEYHSGTSVEVVRVATGGTGSVIQIGFEANIDGAEISIQKMDIFVKQGRVF